MSQFVLFFIILSRGPITSLGITPLGSIISLGVAPKGVTPEEVMGLEFFFVEDTVN